MSKTDAAILEAVESFVEQLKGLIRQAALESVQAVLGAEGSSPGRRAKSDRGRAAVAAKGRATGAKRTSQELEALTKKFHAYVTKNPGQRIEQIGASLGVATKKFSLPVKKLLSEKQISTKGQKRATVYFAK